MKTFDIAWMDKGKIVSYSIWIKGFGFMQVPKEIYEHTERYWRDKILRGSK